MEKEVKTTLKIVTTILLIIMGIITLGMYGCPKYNVYQQRMEGEAQLAHAHAERQVQIQDAEAKFEAAKSLAQAEVERAKGVAQANAIIGDSLKNNESYLRWLYISNLEKAEAAGSQVIYIPTEAGLPILEAGKRK